MLVGVDFLFSGPGTPMDMSWPLRFRRRRRYRNPSVLERQPRGPHSQLDFKKADVQWDPSRAVHHAVLP